MPKQPDIIGRVEHIAIPKLGVADIKAKIDTGADISSLWASQVNETEQGLECTFFAPGSSHYTGEVVVFPKGKYTITRIANSFGHKEDRFMVKMEIVLANRNINATFTLADRSAKLYPVLLGRRLLNKKFLVDVSKGKPLHAAEQARRPKFTKKLD